MPSFTGSFRKRRDPLREVWACCDERIVGESDAVMIASDSRASPGIVTYEVRKIYPIMGFKGGEEVPLAVMGGAGDAAVVRWAYGAVETYLRKRLEEWGIRRFLSSSKRRWSAWRRCS